MASEEWAVLPVLLIMVALFGLLFLTRVGGAWRAELMSRWPSVLFAGAAILALMRGALWPAIAFAAIAALAWVVWPRIAGRSNKAGAARPEDAGDAQARAILGVGPTATESQIRAAYRARMTSAHPDRGGGHDEAARLTAARDRLLRKLR